jgi:transcriptional regulatory protein LevR
MGRIVPPFRKLYQETVSDLQTELKGALVDLGHKSAFDLLLKEAWNPEVAAMGNSTLPTVLDKLNVMSTIHLRKLIAALVRELHQRDSVIYKLEERIGFLEDRLNEIKKQGVDPRDTK